MKNYLLKQAIEITYLGSEKYIQLIQKRLPETGLLDAHQGQLFNKLLTEFADLFANDISEFGRTDLVTHRIYTKDVPPIKSRPTLHHKVNKYSLKKKSKRCWKIT